MTRGESNYPGKGQIQDNGDIPDRERVGSSR